VSTGLRFATSPSFTDAIIFVFRWAESHKNSRTGGRPMR
jgi:hypothetical protein